MTLMWQAYFTPPEAPLQSLNLVTTRRVLAYTIERQGTEKIEWAHGEVETERWHRKSEDGRVDAWFWIAPRHALRIDQDARHADGARHGRGCSTRFGSTKSRARSNERGGRSEAKGGAKRASPRD